MEKANLMSFIDDLLLTIYDYRATGFRRIFNQYCEYFVVDFGCFLILEALLQELVNAFMGLVLLFVVLISSTLVKIKLKEDVCDLLDWF